MIGKMKCKKIVVGLFILICFLQTYANANAVEEAPKEVYLLSYTTNNGKSGLNIAWSINKENWHEIGPNHCFLFSDFGSWGAQKRMYSPYLYQDKSGLWHCIWSLNNEVVVFAHAASKDLIDWKRQSYPNVIDSGNFTEPEVHYDALKEAYIISWLNTTASIPQAYQTTTIDFKTYSSAKKIALSERKNDRVEVVFNGTKVRGMINKTSWDVVDKLIKREEWVQFHNQERNEDLNDDATRFKDLKPLEAKIVLQPEKSKSISDLLIGIFFEDINYAADGGLYAELIQNRGFEYKISDTKNRDSTWVATKAWSVIEDAATLKIQTQDPLHSNTPHYAVLDVQKVGTGLTNGGFDGISVIKGEKYDVSVFAKRFHNSKTNLTVRLKRKNGAVIGETVLKNINENWKKYSSIIKVTTTVSDAVLEIIPTTTGKIALDMISLFPQNTFNNRKNGLRKDLAQTIADLNPKFVRFPGGCVAHGDGIDNIYNWKKTIGNLEERVPQRNIWNYHQTGGLGYFEYFQFCEDLKAEPIPVIAAGVPCQNSATGGHGQQCGVPMEEMDAYIQDILDLIEWANGDKNSKWGKKRAEAGHPKPFNLKYIGIGNEDLITDIFEERFTLIFKAIKEKHPEITVIGTVGPFYMGTDYEEGWDLADRLEIPMVDEHYYQTPGWFINNQDFYDSYDRSKSKVYLGEYAAHVSGRRMNMQTALSEALYLTGVERNADVVSMTSFAPLLAKKGHTQWNPDLIYFDNTKVDLTVDYYVQKLYGTNSGDSYIPSTIQLSNKDKKVKNRVAISVVEDSKSNDLILKLVNLLTVTVASSIDLEAYNFNPEAELTVLKGQPKDENQIPVVSRINVSKLLEYQLPAYSFSVIRIKTEK